jgi:carbamoyl-phosphate synthase small subunit
VVVMDFGVKTNILRSLCSVKLNPIVVPANTSFEKILSLKPKGILLSNGPGDPEGVPYAIETVKKLINYKPQISDHGPRTTDYGLPLFGICLGHQILGLAMGGRTYKLKFGHHGSNQPIKNLKTSRIEISAENHNFAVDLKTLNDVIPTYMNLNDGTLEGMEHKKLPVFSVQFHPEASPGPHDTGYLFEKFAGMVKKYAKKK